MPIPKMRLSANTPNRVSGWPQAASSASPMPRAIRLTSSTRAARAAPIRRHSSRATSAMASASSSASLIR
ncbi:hypothetical protein D3C86_1996870 [compost metagenome]